MTMAGKRKRFSIRIQFALIFIALMVGVILLCWALNTLFLEDYYIQKKQRIILDAYETIRRAAEQDNYEADTFMRELEEVCRNYNITVCIMDVDSQIKYVSQNGGRQLEARMYGYIFGYEHEPLKILENGEDYRVQITGQGEGEYLEMYGQKTE